MRIRELREDAELSQRILAEYLCIHQRTYSGYETGEIRIPVDVLIKLANLYGVSIEYILGLTEERIIPKTHIRI
ncbi:MAG: helix-turn-helix domain-containing protein [Candidatus Gastranaerophilaceae bacterium]|nr:helix-turn-helix transcriptional regulator [Christensenellales bacterium]